MSLKLVQSSNIKVVTQRDRDIEDLELKIRQTAKPSPRDRVVFAYHFCRLDQPFKAQIQLNKINPEYFESGIYRDLWRAMFCFSLKKSSPNLPKLQGLKECEFFLIIRKAVPMFKHLVFEGKPVFLDFVENFEHDLRSIT